MYRPVKIMFSAFNCKNTRSSIAKEFLNLRDILTQSTLWTSQKSICGQSHKQTLPCEFLSLSAKIQIHCQQYLQLILNSTLKTKGPILHLRGKFCLYGFFETLGVRYNFCHYCVPFHEGDHGFNKIWNEEVKTGFHSVNLWRNWKFCHKRLEFFPCLTLVHWLER